MAPLLLLSGYAHDYRNECSYLSSHLLLGKSEACAGRCIPFSRLRKSFLPSHCHKDYLFLTLMVLCRKIELAWNMLGMYIESLGRCGAATPQRLSFSPASWPGGWCPEPDLPFAVFRFCKRQWYRLSFFYADPNDHFSITVHIPFSYAFIQLRLIMKMGTFTHRTLAPLLLLYAFYFPTG